MPSSDATMFLIFLEAIRLRTALALLFLTASWPVLAQPEQNEKLRQVISDLRACVRTHAPRAQAAGIRTTSEAVEFFSGKCGPPLSDLAPADVGTVPPGSFRHAIVEAWTAAKGKSGIAKATRRRLCDPDAYVGKGELRGQRDSLAPRPIPIVRVKLRGCVSDRTAFQ